MKEIRSFTGLRGIAAVYVMLYHFKFYELLPASFRYAGLHGYLSVDIFFVLSGVVMAMTYQHLFRPEEGNFSENYRLFLWRRIARIYPLYLFVTLLFVGLIFLFPSKFPQSHTLAPDMLVPNLLMVQAWGIAESYVGPGWSISTEMAAYLLFPLFAFIFLFSAKMTAGIAVVLCIILLAGIVLLPEDITGIIRSRGQLDITDGRHYGPLARCVLGFCLGVFTYRIMLWLKQTRWITSDAAAISVAMIMIGLLFLKNSDLAFVLMVPFLLLVIHRDDNVVARLLANRFCYHLGVISYSLYLLHVLGFFLKNTTYYHASSVVGEGSLALAATIIVQMGFAFVLANVCYYGFEKPSRNWIRKWGEPVIK